MKKVFKIFVIGIVVLISLPIISEIVIAFSPKCTIDNGGPGGSKEVQTCDCFGYEHFNGWESGADSKCIGYVTERFNID